MHEDVPAHLRHQLWMWTARFLGQSTAQQVQRTRAVANHMRYDYASIPMYSGGSIEYSMEQYIEERCRSDPEAQLRIIEFLLPAFLDPSYADELEHDLRTGNSAYAVADHGKSLVWRQDPTARSAVEKAIAGADEGPAHWLAEAWNDAYGRQSRPGPAYDAAIRAVEGALRGIVIPRNSRATITQIINALRDGSTKFEFDLTDSRGDVGANEPRIDGVEVVIAMLRSLAYGQKTRHGDSGHVTVNSETEARTAVHLAVTLVEIGTTGSLRRR